MTSPARMVLLAVSFWKSGALESANSTKLTEPDPKPCVWLSQLRLSRSMNIEKMNVRTPLRPQCNEGTTGEGLSAKPIFGPDFEPHSGVIHKSQFCWKAASGIWLFWNNDCQDGRNWRDGRSHFPLNMYHCGRKQALGRPRHAIS